MSRIALAATVLGVGAIGVLAVGGWLFFTGSVDSPDEPASPKTGTAEGEPGTPRTFDVPRCPIRVRADSSFERRETETRSPNLRLHSEQRVTQINIGCRLADEGFDRENFLEETLRSVEGRFDGEIDGKREVESGPAAGWTTWRTTGNQLRIFNVLVRDTTIVTVHLFGPDNPGTRDLNQKVVEEGILWAGTEGDADTGP